MMNKLVKLSDVVEFNPENINKNFSCKEITYLDISSVGTGFADFNNIIQYSTAPSRAKRIAQNNDTILATVRPGNKSYCFIKNKPHNLVVSTGFAVIRAINNVLDSRYLYYIISDESCTSFLVANEQGANYPAVTPDIIGRYEFSLPPLPIQQRIASILSAYDDLIENNLKRIKLLEELAQRTYEEWFVKFRINGEQLPIDENTGLPFGWEKKKIGEIYKTSSGGTPSRKKEDRYYKNGEIPWIKTKELNNTIIIDSEEKITDIALKESSAKYFTPNTVLLAMYGNTIGETGFLAIGATTNQACCAFIFNESNMLNSYFVHQFLMHNKNLILGYRMGAAQENISQEIIKAIDILNPDKRIIDKFGILLSSIYDQLKVLYISISKLKESRDLILPRLMNGTVKIDEP